MQLNYTIIADFPGILLKFRQIEQIQLMYSLS